MKEKNKGITLIVLIITVVILTILSTLMISTFSGDVYNEAEETSTEIKEEINQLNNKVNQIKQGYVEIPNEENSMCSHTYGEWEIITAATCTATGSKERTCTECGQGETEEIEALGHSYGEWEITTAATCTTVGTKTKTCATCGAQETQSIEALGHNYVSGTCSACGTKELITFTIDDTTYNAEYGMTWVDFIGSSWNQCDCYTTTVMVAGVSISGVGYNHSYDGGFGGGGYIGTRENQFVRQSDQIEDQGEYFVLFLD